MVEERGTMTLGGLRPESDCELDSKVAHLLKHGAGGQEGSDQKENKEEKNREEMFSLFRKNSSKMCAWNIGAL